MRKKFGPSPSKWLGNSASNFVMSLEELSNIESLPDEILLKIVKLSSALSKEEQDRLFPSYLRHFFDLVQILTSDILAKVISVFLKKND